MNPLLSKLKLPGRVFQLPSKGVFYDEGVLDKSVVNGEIQVHAMSALAELKLKTPDLLFSGKALVEVCKECIPEILRPELLLTKDVDAIFCFLRVATYGSTMNIRTSHDCKNAKVNDYTVNVEDIIVNSNNSVLDHADLLYTYNLSTDQTIKLKPVNYSDLIELTHMRHALSKSISDTGTPDSELMQNITVNDLLAIIESVDGIKDRNLINEWARNLKKSHFNELIKHSESCSQWGYNLNVTLQCKDCGEQFNYELELDPINFFSA